MDTTIYRPMLNEGTTVWRPILAADLGHGRYSIIGEPSDDEEWAFATGTAVMVDSDKRIVAAATVDDMDHGT